MKKSLKLSIYLFFATFSIVAFILFFNAVDNSLTEEDIIYLKKIVDLPKVNSDTLSYEEQIELISHIQNAVLEVAPINKGIELNRKREPKDLLQAGHGLCFDRSRVIEKILKYYGFKTRHIFMYARQGASCFLQPLLQPGIPSHALTEVLTKNGWLIVDSNHKWLSITKDNKPISVNQFSKAFLNGRSINWKTVLPNEVYREPFYYIYGLYSRHGKFYPPFNAIPDINYSELIQNFY
ncbi:MAG: hypothetical protein Kow0037_20670 [Calditrichia bacterium]